ncbi:hypothetical protein Mgra_00002646 [Meloidogyne graminicola]|uniref:WAP domain-containing protein n=1 Tax=Meloidogyne graminicola TaxID=189291 RepID=A0A8S9ZW43_9BILA|nr:hypothetical protein Mgra_00002646 [Meloidogyne graminicola]
MFINLFLILILILINLLLSEFGKTSSCNSNYSAYTCNPIIKSLSKCPKPHICVASKCGINFCCVNDKLLLKFKEKKSEEIDDEENNENIKIKNEI